MACFEVTANICSSRCECKTHILRTHPERLHSRVRVDTYITDLNRKAASVRSQKKRQTLDRCRREGEEGGGVRLASTGHRKALEVLKGEEKPTGGGKDVHVCLATEDRLQ